MGALFSCPDGVLHRLDDLIFFFTLLENNFMALNGLNDKL